VVVEVEKAMKVRNSLPLGFIAALASAAVLGASPTSADFMEEIVVTAPYPAHLLMEEIIVTAPYPAHLIMEEIVVTAPRPVSLFVDETQELADTTRTFAQRPDVTLAL
jgi:hypothetical protein